ncbi:hypothetical protein SAY87_003741 [Trapa incisa]|uniref:Uncharacterized protein n=1 Tax=Trapa incisa TaxID=236973 RepID=A0AAN7KL63_9MYRT|nr:hypothetical protein SAY87_003741 [Trapa incisa]
METNLMKGNVASQDFPPSEGLSTASALATDKILELPDQSPLAQPVPTSYVTKTPDDFNPERRDEVLPSPVSLASSSWPSKGHHSSETSRHMRVFSPELDGDLHLFDVSPLFTAGELSRAPAEVIGRSFHGTLSTVVIS